MLRVIECAISSGRVLTDDERNVAISALREVAALLVPGRRGRPSLIAQWSDDKLVRHSAMLPAMLAQKYLEENPVARPGKPTKLRAAVAEVLPGTATSKQREAVYRQLTSLRSKIRRERDYTASILDMLSSSKSAKTKSRKKRTPQLFPPKPIPKS